MSQDSAAAETGAGEAVRRPVRRALISVYDKTGVVELAAALASAGVTLVSTGRTAAAIADAGVPVTTVEQITGFPECLDGRVKTLHPRIHAGLLADLRRPDHVAQLADLGVEPFDLVISNLYPFRQTVLSGAGIDDVVEQIDIGGPSMIRAAAKNYPSVAVVVDSAGYGGVLAAVEAGGFTLAERKQLAVKAFAHTAAYDVAVASWMGTVLSPPEDGWPEFTGATWERSAVLRYGENPHQRAALYRQWRGGVASAEQLHGKEMSFNNYVDIDAAWRAANDFADPAVAVIKHTNPCGLAVVAGGSDADIAEAHRKAHECDPASAYGGVIAANRPVTAELASQVAKIFTEVLLAPDYAPEALEILLRRKNLRVLRMPQQWTADPIRFTGISGGVLAQTVDNIDAPGDDPAAWTLATGQPADADTLADLAFAWRACRSVKSNAIVLAAGGATVGIGMGQVNRVDSARLAVARAGDRAVGSVAASDAFFPFPDGLQVLIDGGVRAVVQPGGSIRDPLSVEAAEAAGITMYLTGTRHFWH